MCVVVDFEALCVGDPKALAALAAGFRLDMAAVERVKLSTCEHKARECIWLMSAVFRRGMNGGACVL
jgi:hypothetical protein